MIRFTLNGTQIEITDGENRTLLEYLRNVKCMKGTKEACSTGHCGACSVLVDGRLTLVRNARAPSGRQSSRNHRKCAA